ncbi:MAG: DUF4010 domain-containing protein [Candidatus Thermoplasmatota archaeon]|nr:DUF4010 domain-containing protein [Candidatus Thermoplasmatota archaeon]
MDELALISELKIIQNLLISIGLGILIGLEREHHKRVESGERAIVIAGIRTFPIVALCGTLLAIITRLASESGQISGALLPYFSLLIPLGLFGFILLALVMFYAKHQLELTGLTTPITVIATFILGVLVGFELWLVSLICCVAITLLLVSKKRLHELASVLTESELMSALGFISVAFILLPLAPNEPIFGIFNFKWMLSIIVFVSAVSFVSFLAMRRYGITKGILFSSLFGGLVNSEATTASLSHHVKRKNELLSIVTLGIVVSNTTMLIRNLIIAGFADPHFKVLSFMLLPIAAMCVVNIVHLSLSPAPMRVEEELKIDIKSPFAVIPATKFGVLFVLVASLGYAVTHYLGKDWIYLTALGGFASSGAVVASLALLAYQFPGEISFSALASTCLLACIISTLTNIGIAGFSSKELAKKVTKPLIITALVGTIAIIILLRFIMPLLP